MKGKPSGEFIEAEFGFRLRAPRHFRKLLEKLWSDSGLLELDGVTAARVEEKIERSVHLFSARTRGDAKERLRLISDKDGLKAKLDRKRITKRVKYERSVDSSRKRKRIVHLMNYVQPTITVFCKERSTLVYKFISTAERGKVENHYVKVGIDIIVAMSLPVSRSGKYSLFYDVDIEGDGSGSERLFVSSTFFRKEVLAYLVPLEKSTAKWRVAKAAAGGRPMTRKFKCYAEVMDFFRLCMENFGKAFPDRCVLGSSRG